VRELKRLVAKQAVELDFLSLFTASEAAKIGSPAKCLPES
jgi:hypothetical protein